MTCRICKNTESSAIVLTEKMFGINEKFNYFICTKCECIQIETIPNDLSKYYPVNYYSFNEVPALSFKWKIKKLLYQTISTIQGDFYVKPDFADFGIVYKERNKKILDIGCGSGTLLYEMKNAGFNYLFGSDPFLNKETHLKGLKLFKKDINEINGKYDIIMSHHSLEHMPDPHDFFKNIYRLLNDDGRLILRIPIYPNYIWDKYRTGWIQLDAPRHLQTFTLKGIKILCDENKLKINRIDYDGHAWSLASTEFCLNGKTHEEFKKNIQISEQQYAENKQANESNNGDSVRITIEKNS